MNDIKELLQPYFKIPLGSLDYKEFSIMKNSYILLSPKFWYFFLRMHKKAFVKNSFFNSFIILKKFMFIYKVLECKKFDEWKSRDIVRCFNIAIAWSEGRFNPDIVKIIEKERKWV
jgi:hypothetical protein